MKEKVSKNCFEQMTKLNATLQEMNEMRAETEANRQKDTRQVAAIDDLQHKLDETARERDEIAGQVHPFDWLFRAPTDASTDTPPTHASRDASSDRPN